MAAMAEKEEKGGDRWGLAGFCVAAALTVAGVWLAAQIFSLFASAETLTGARRAVAFAFAWLAVALVAFVAAWGLWLFRRLPGVPKLRAADFAESPEGLKAALRKGYLARLGDADGYAARAGFQGKQAEEVAERIRRLRADAPAGGEDAYLDWTAAFRILQERQDERAGEIINRAMGLVAVKTAASPWKVVDALAVFYVSTLMVFEIAKVYNRRTTRAGALRLVGRWAFNIYVAREMGSVAESGMDAVTGAAGHLMKPNGISGAIASSLPLVGKIASKAVEGGANAFFARSLGKRAIREFQAVEF